MKEMINDYIKDIFYDTITSIINRKVGSHHNESERNKLVEEYIANLRMGNMYYIESTQALINQKQFNKALTATINGKSCYKLVKLGAFGKIKLCYFITKRKDEIDGPYLEQVYDELNKQSMGMNVFNSPDYKND